jgi:hypothetical protein
MTALKKEKLMTKMTAKKREQIAQKMINKVRLSPEESLIGMAHLQKAHEGLRDMITFGALLDLGLMPVDIPYLLSEVEEKHRKVFEMSNANFDAILRWKQMYNTLANKAVEQQ